MDKKTDRLMFVFENKSVYRVLKDEVVTTLDLLDWRDAKKVVHLIINSAKIAGIETYTQTLILPVDDEFAESAIEIKCEDSESIEELTAIAKTLLPKILTKNTDTETLDLEFEDFFQNRDDREDFENLIDGFVEKNGGKKLRNSGALFCGQDKILDMRGSFAPKKILDFAPRKFHLSGTVEGLTRYDRELQVLVIPGSMNNAVLKKEAESLFSIGINVDLFFEDLREKLGDDQVYNLEILEFQNEKGQRFLELTSQPRLVSKVIKHQFESKDGESDSHQFKLEAQG